MQAKWTGVVVFLALFAAQSADARVWHVDLDGTADFTSIQAAIDSVGVADTILVAAGTYDENLDTKGKWLVFLSESGPEVTIIDGGQRGSVVRLIGGGILEGFTVRNGLAQDAGGGVHVDTSTGTNAGGVVRNCIIENNRAGFAPDFGCGGGVYLSGLMHDFVIEYSVIRNNLAGRDGGGISNVGYRTVIQSTKITNNLCQGSGGGYRAWFWDPTGLFGG